jgi:hypothetical protein
MAPFKQPDGQHSFFPVIDRRNQDMWVCEDGFTIEKIEAMFIEIRKSFPFIPFKTHNLL